jgi:hypothetical protein
MCVQTAKPTAKPPHDVDKETAISKQKNGNATVHDRIPAEFIKEGGKEIKKVIYELI